MSCYGTVGVYSQIAFLIVWPIVAICLTPLIGLLLALLFKHTTALELRALGWRRGDRGLIDAVLLGQLQEELLLGKGWPQRRVS